MSSSAQPRYYFAYGSNLSPTQMALRCPSSEPVGLAHLPHYAFIINSRRYANVVPAPDSGAAAPGVYGVLYDLHPDDETVLDRCEGVPVAYQKEILPVTVVTTIGSSSLAEQSSIRALIYIDHVRQDGSTPWPEYIDRVNRGVDEATARFGLPAGYVDEVIRKWIPAPGTPDGGPEGAGAIEDPFL
ncbi:AIG2 family protein [Colletotrichum plurivorum]|uniref:gamma-glutamylcyclotransferase n=1 Tax=Colletotrichum plurivorum TaxID=2175906 RepID=A0A8H6NNN0_9PEZI|nr:AIG2 family protein [Colletotrichum plurivorum]